MGPWFPSFPSWLFGPVASRPESGQNAVAGGGRHDTPQRKVLVSLCLEAKREPGAPWFQQLLPGPNPSARVPPPKGSITSSSTQASDQGVSLEGTLIQSTTELLNCGSVNMDRTL